MFENMRLSLSVSRFIKTGIIIPPKYILEAVPLIKNGLEIEEAMTSVLYQAFINNDIERSDLTDEGKELLDFALKIANEELNIKKPSFEIKSNSGKVRTEVSNWILDDNEIIKDIRAYKNEEFIQHVQVRYSNKSMDPTGILNDFDPSLGDVMKGQRIETLAFLYSPPIGAGDGYLILQASNMGSEVKITMVVKILDQDDFSILQLKEHIDVKKLAKLFSSQQDIVCELIDMNKETVGKFVVPNEPGFSQLRESMN